jgi:hypothetical protein
MVLVDDTGLVALVGVGLLVMNEATARRYGSNGVSPTG